MRDTNTDSFSHSQHTRLLPDTKDNRGYEESNSNDNHSDCQQGTKHTVKVIVIEKGGGGGVGGGGGGIIGGGVGRRGGGVGGRVRRGGGGVGGKGGGVGGRRGGWVGGRVKRGGGGVGGRVRRGGGGVGGRGGGVRGRRGGGVGGGGGRRGGGGENEENLVYLDIKKNRHTREENRFTRKVVYRLRVETSPGGERLTKAAPPDFINRPSSIFTHEMDGYTCQAT
ncbi:hypothetical protein Pmani_033296 [Petrolisthes manimaculis]|uniref:Uncharacterized protein n=1 Tax=Petrolisthes manimaculis TaxID=1843537 RepID=A0AAE1NR78_9EUCA|nr:hypothetical protein Pmani_033296 [Petrolisthes manimaculis]